jgi:pilus assembly protein Flp/PilA
MPAGNPVLTLVPAGAAPTFERTRFMLARAHGQGMLEYALIIALVAVVVIASLIVLGPQISRIFLEISNQL